MGPTWRRHGRQSYKGLDPIASSRYYPHHALTGTPAPHRHEKARHARLAMAA